MFSYESQCKITVVVIHVNDFLALSMVAKIFCGKHCLKCRKKYTKKIANVEDDYNSDDY